MNDDIELLSEIPGPHTRNLATTLRRFESRNVTYLSDEFPVFWEAASGATILDVDGNRYLDLTSAFGVANVGHANPHVAAAIAGQATRLMHGMGDVHPTEVRARLVERIPEILPPGLTKTFLSTTGSEAVEAAMKTALLATGKPHFAAYHGAYHGLSLGALVVSGLEKFRRPFGSAIGGDTVLLAYPREGIDDVGAALAVARDVLSVRRDIAALVIEPIQGRGGCVIPPRGYLPGLRTLCDQLGILLIFDEIYTGFGRTGAWFAAMHEDVTPDIICIGKAMGSGFPISATVARDTIMDAWPISQGEALHTSTYLGNPMGCAAALATIHELQRLQLPERANLLGDLLHTKLHALKELPGVVAVRGRGMMWGVQLRDAALADRVVKLALQRGVIALQAGPEGDVISITPPLVITERQLFCAIDVLQECIVDESSKDVTV